MIDMNPNGIPIPYEERPREPKMSLNAPTLISGPQQNSNFQKFDNFRGSTFQSFNNTNHVSPFKKQQFQRQKSPLNQRYNNTQSFKPTQRQLNFAQNSTPNYTNPKKQMNFSPNIDLSKVQSNQKQSSIPYQPQKVKHTRPQKQESRNQFETFRSGRNNANPGMNSLIFKKSTLGNSQTGQGPQPQRQIPKLELAQNPQVDYKKAVGFGSAFESRAPSGNQQNRAHQNKNSLQQRQQNQSGAFQKRNAQQMNTSNQQGRNQNKPQNGGGNPLSFDATHMNNMDKHKRIQQNINLRQNIQNTGGVYSDNPLQVQPTFARNNGKNGPRKKKLPQYQNFGNQQQGKLTQGGGMVFRK